MSVYWIIPSGSKPIIFFFAIFAILAGVGALLFASVLGSQRSRFELKADALRIRGDLYGRTIPYVQLRMGEARVVDLRGEPRLQPVSRRMGTALPGYASGWFRLRSGEKALAYLTDRTRVLYLPTTEGYSILLSPQHGDAMLADLNERVRASR